MASPRPAARRNRFPYFSLITLAVAVFISVTIETLPFGLLPQMSRELKVSESAIGLTVSLFAFTVVVTSTPLIALLRRVPRHTLVVTVLFVLAASVVLTALAPNYGVLVVSRILGGIAHGVFWSVVGAYTAYLVPKEHLGRAVSITLGGGSLAFVLGVPLGTALGNAVGWRVAFGVLAALAVVAGVFVYRFIPRVDHLAQGIITNTPTGSITMVTDDVVEEPPLTREQSAAAVVVVCVATALTMIGQYTFYTFIAPFLIGPVGLPEAAVSPALFAYGIAGSVSLVLVAIWLGRRPRASILGSMVLVILSVLVLAVVPQLPVLSIVLLFVWGLFMGNLPPLLQTRMLHAAPARIRDASSAAYTSSFNVGIGGGALVGSLVLNGFGLRALPFVMVGLVAVGFVVLLVADAFLRRPLSVRS